MGKGLKGSLPTLLVPPFSPSWRSAGCCWPSTNRSLPSPWPGSSPASWSRWAACCGWWRSPQAWWISVTWNTAKIRDGLLSKKYLKSWVWYFLMCVCFWVTVDMFCYFWWGWMAENIQNRVLNQKKNWGFPPQHPTTHAWSDLQSGTLSTVSTTWARKSTAASDPRVGVTFGHQSQERLTHLTTCGDRETCEAQLALQFFQLLAPAASNTSGPGVIWDGNSSGDVFGDLYIVYSSFQMKQNQVCKLDKMWTNDCFPNIQSFDVFKLNRGKRSNY